MHCRADILVPDQYQHGDHIKCGACGMRHKVTRGEREGVRLVIADVAPLREALHANQQLVGRLEDELRGARHSIGMGANGVGIGVAYFIWQVALKEQPVSLDLAWSAALVALGSGAVLELVNYLALAKRQAISRISRDLEDARNEGRSLQQKIREASRVVGTRRPDAVRSGGRIAHRSPRTSVVCEAQRRRLTRTDPGATEPALPFRTASRSRATGGRMAAATVPCPRGR